MRMKAAVIEKPKVLRITEREVPILNDNEVLVKTKAAGICGTDVHIYTGEYFADYPLIPGHEITGEIAGICKGVKGFKEGDRVAIHPANYCFECHFCKKGAFNQCINKKAYGIKLDGGFSEYIKVNARNLYKLNSISFQEGAFAEPLGCVLHSLDRANISLGDDVLIFGCGTMGMLHLQSARVCGASSVTCVDIRKDKLDLAKKMGADYVFCADQTLDDNLKDVCKLGFDLVIDDTGSTKVIVNMPKYTKSRGTILYFGVCSKDVVVSIKPYEIFQRELKIIGSCSLELKFQESLKLIESKRVDVKQLISTTTDLNGLEDIFRIMMNNQGLYKNMLVF